MAYKRAIEEMFITNNFSNTTFYNHDMLLEIGKSSQFSGVKQRSVAIALIFFIGIGLMILGERVRGGVFIISGFLAVIIELAVSGKRAKWTAKKLADQLNTIHHSEEFPCEMVIDDAMIHLKYPHLERELLHSDIEKVCETKKYYLILYKGNIFTVVDKNGFANGTEEQFLTLIKRKD